MRPEVVILSIILAGWLIGLGYCHNRSCPDCQTVKAAVAPPVESTPIGIEIQDDVVGFASETNDNLLFATDNCEYNTPLSDKLQTVFGNTVTHLQENTNRILVLEGLYEGTESNNCTDQANLGIARAGQVKQLLVEMGAPEDRIEVGDSDITDLAEYNDYKVGGVNYLFKEAAIPTTNTPVEEETALRTDKIILYFDTNKKEINLTTEQRNYLDRLNAFLAQNPDAKASVTGHTDSKGDDKWNMRLSRKRSEFVRDFMIDQGIPKRQIRNEGIGPDQPIASNSTEEGRAKNRRVEITLQ